MKVKSNSKEAAAYAKGKKKKERKGIIEFFMSKIDFMDMNMSRSQNMPGFSCDFHPNEFPLGMAYVPMQESINMFENLEKAYRIGTVFPCLDKPFTGRRCVR